MEKEQMVGTKLPETVIPDLEAIERFEQADRSTTVGKLLSPAIGDWKLDHYSRLYGGGKLTLALAAREYVVRHQNFAPSSGSVAHPVFFSLRASPFTVRARSN